VVFINKSLSQGRRLQRQLKSNQTELHLILPLRLLHKLTIAFLQAHEILFLTACPQVRQYQPHQKRHRGLAELFVTRIRKKKPKIMETNRKNKFGDNHWKHGRCSDTQQVNNCQEVLLLGYRMLRTQKASFVATGPTMQLVSSSSEVIRLSLFLLQRSWFDSPSTVCSLHLVLCVSYRFDRRLLALPTASRRLTATGKF
jgi:hypothetical protein